MKSRNTCCPGGADFPAGAGIRPPDNQYRHVCDPIYGRRSPQLYTLRLELELLALQWARPRVTENDLKELSHQIAKVVEAGERGDRRQFLELDYAFHKRCWALSGNTYLAETLDRLMAPLFTFVVLASGAPLTGSMGKSTMNWCMHCKIRRSPNLPSWSASDCLDLLLVGSLRSRRATTRPCLLIARRVGFLLLCLCCGFAAAQQTAIKLWPSGGSGSTGGSAAETVRLSPMVSTSSRTSRIRRSFRICRKRMSPPELR